MSYYLEILGRSVTLPDPVIVTALSGSYRAIATEIGDTRSQLSALASPSAAGEWTGLAADAFAGQIGALPGQLGKAWQSYSTVAWALSDYADQLDPVVAALRRLAYEAEDAEGTLRGTMIAHDQIIQQGQDPQATGWNTRLQEAKANVGAIEQSLCTLLAELDALSAECVTRIRQAQAEGIQNNLITDFQRYVVQDTLVPYAKLNLTVDWVALKAIVDFADDVVITPFTKLVSDLRDWDPERPWESFGAVAGDLAGVLGVLSLVPGVGEVVFPAMLLVSAVALVSDAAAAGTHEKGATWTQVGLDSISLACAGVGHVAGAGVDQGEQLLASGSDAQVSAGALMSAGIQHDLTWEPMQAAADEGGQAVSPLRALTDDAYSWLHFGVDSSTHSPAAVELQQLEFLTDRTGNLVDVYTAEHDKGNLP